MITWTPASEFEQRLTAAYAAGDLNRSLSLLRHTQVALPASREAHEGREPYRWPMYQGETGTRLIAFTSIEAMQAASDGAMRYARISTLAELAAGWPDHTWGLAVNPGLEVQFDLDSAAVARVAAPSLSDFAKADPKFAPVLQKVLTLAELDALLDNDLGTVSGYVHFAADVEDLGDATAGQILEALALEQASHLRDNGSVFALRWRPLALDLYAPSYGGTTPEARDAVAGGIVEHEPYVGLGLGRNRDFQIREFKAMRAPLPAAAELWELTSDGRQERRGVLDLGQTRWKLFGSAADYDGPDAPLTPTELAGLRSRGDMARSSGRFVARYQGGDFTAAVHIEESATTVELRDGSGGLVDAVPLDACEALHYERVVCTWRAAPFVVVIELDDKLVLEYLGNNAIEADQLGLERHDQGVYRATVARDEARSTRSDFVPILLPQEATG
ncbi:hypothetical protein EK0264_11690 [Epidermidibacterium keratini]|uniref:SseB protein N-terminal domain-containing protein n=1 Tax=Epidermidibacterium keratini TaxID=1891644 RepID=A0A7L4YPC6_9ACTN|nr:SseB family protein [Epidermidibacterium keratini]QHC00882.1 hypothetical protein EK0264_11690 [Epidermidibacterium keratini]